MVKYLCIAAVIGAGSAACRAGDFGDALPLDQRVAALEKKVEALERKVGGFPELPAVGKPIVSPFAAKTAEPTVVDIYRADGPFVLGPGPTTIPLHPVVQGPVVNPDGIWAYPVTGQSLTCANGQCSTGTGFVQFQQPSRPGLFGRIFGR